MATYNISDTKRLANDLGLDIRQLQHAPRGYTGAYDWHVRNVGRGLWICDFRCGDGSRRGCDRSLVEYLLRVRDNTITGMATIAAEQRHREICTRLGIASPYYPAAE